MVSVIARRAFTLIELLVVVAIIVILIAVLIPALTAALYMATLASCSASMDGFATSVTLYAHSNKDNYPYRKVLDIKLPTDEVAGPVYLFSGYMGLLKWAPDGDDPNYGSGTQYDDRAMWSAIVDLNKTFLDPFAEPISLNDTSADPAKSTNEDNDYIIASQDILVNWSWNGEGRMQKLGSKSTWTAPAGHIDAGRTFSWDLLMMDRDIQVYDALYTVALALDQFDNWEIARSSHPDKEGLMREVVMQGFSDPEEDKSVWVSEFSTEGPRHYPQTGGVPQSDSHVDRNFAHADGSVETLKETFTGHGMNTGETPGPGARPLTPPGNRSDVDERFTVAPADRVNSYFYGTTMMPRR